MPFFSAPKTTAANFPDYAICIIVPNPTATQAPSNLSVAHLSRMKVDFFADPYEKISRILRTMELVGRATEPREELLAVLDKKLDFRNEDDVRSGFDAYMKKWNDTMDVAKKERVSSRFIYVRDMIENYRRIYETASARGYNREGMFDRKYTELLGTLSRVYPAATKQAVCKLCAELKYGDERHELALLRPFFVQAPRRTMQSSTPSM